MAPLVRCYCKVCNGVLVAPYVFRSHERSDLRQRTLADQAHFTRRVGQHIPQAHADVRPIPRGFSVPLHEPPPPLSPEFNDPLDDTILDSALTDEDLGIPTPGSPLPNLGPNVRSPDALLAAIDHFDAYSAVTMAGARPLTAHDAHRLPIDPGQHAFERHLAKTVEEMQREQATLDDEEEIQDFDGDGCFDGPDEEDDRAPIQTEPGEDDPDPFLPDDDYFSEDHMDLSHLPHHLLVIYALVSWLHLQFHLPRVACNALLAILTCILLSIAPTIETPFITLQSSNRVLGVDKTIYTLPVCPSCREVFPPAGSPHTVDACPICLDDLFLPGHTLRGNQRAVKSPVIKYPYLPLSEQLKSLLKIPGLEALLDAWRMKPRIAGQYTDIFDGAMCRTKLKDPNGKLFFSNLPHEKNGPDDELRIGVNLGLDWYVYRACRYL